MGVTELTMPPYWLTRSSRIRRVIVPVTINNTFYLKHIYSLEEIIIKDLDSKTIVMNRIKNIKTVILNLADVGINVKRILLPKNRDVSFYNDAFSEAKKLEEINLENISAVSSFRFCQCNKLNNIGNLSSCAVIGDYAFKGTVLNMKKLNINAYKVGDCALLNAGYIGELSIGLGVQVIGDFAFKDTKIKTVVFEGGTELEINREAFNSVEKIIFKFGTYRLYHKALYGLKGVKEIDLIHVTKIGESVFEHSNVSIVKNINSKELEDLAFYGCTELKEVVFTDKVEYIGNGVFQHCTELIKVSLGRGIQLIGNMTFNDCCNIKELTLYENVREIGDGALRGTGLKVITILSMNLKFYDIEELSNIPTLKLVRIRRGALIAGERRSKISKPKRTDVRIEYID